MLNKNQTMLYDFILMRTFFSDEKPNFCYSPINLERMQDTYINIMHKPISNNFFLKQLDKITKIVQLILIIPNEIATSSIDLSVGNLYRIYEYREGFNLLENKCVVLATFIGCCCAGSLFFIPSFLGTQYISQLLITESSCVGIRFFCYLIWHSSLFIQPKLVDNLEELLSNAEFYNADFNFFNAVKKILTDKNLLSYEKILLIPLALMLDFIINNATKFLIQTVLFAKNQTNKNPSNIKDLLIQLLCLPVLIVVPLILTAFVMTLYITYIILTLMLTVEIVIPWIMLIFFVYKADLLLKEEPPISTVPSYESFLPISIKELEKLQIFSDDPNKPTECCITLESFDKNDSCLLEKKWVVIRHNNKMSPTLYIYETPEEQGLATHIKLLLQGGKIPNSPATQLPLKFNQIRRVVP